MWPGMEHFVNVNHCRLIRPIWRTQVAPSSAVSGLFAPIDLAPLREVAEVVLGALQVVGFAGVLWMASAAPGFLADHASTVAAIAR